MKINVSYGECGPFGGLWFAGFDNDEGEGMYGSTPVEALQDLLAINDHDEDRVAACEAEIAKREQVAA